MADLNKKKQLFIKIKEIAYLQRSAIEQGDMKQLQALIEERQRCSEIIDALHTQDVDEELPLLIAQIQEIDKGNRQMLEHMMDEAIAKINGVKTAKTGLAAYSAGFSQVFSAFVDKKM